MFLFIESAKKDKISRLKPVSKQVCEKEGGHLVKITSQVETDNIVKLWKKVNQYSQHNWFYIGLNDIEEEGVYRWESDKSIMEYDNFHLGKTVGSQGCILP